MEDAMDTTRAEASAPQTAEIPVRNTPVIHTSYNITDRRLDESTRPGRRRRKNHQGFCQS